MNLQDKLEDCIYEYTRNTGQMVTTIVVHPKTMHDLRVEIFDHMHDYLNMGIQKNIKYRGIKVIRSLDLKEGEILVFS